MENLTKIHILNSFNELLREYPIEKITVKMIVEKSEISKATFYRWFIDKYDVMNWNYKKNLDKWVNNQKVNGWKELFIQILYASKQDIKREKNAYSYIGTNSYSAALSNYSYQKVNEVSTKARGGKPLTMQEQVSLAIFCYGTVSLIIDWVNGKYDCDTEKLGEMIYMSMPESLRDLWID